MVPEGAAGGAGPLTWRREELREAVGSSKFRVGARPGRDRAAWAAPPGPGPGKTFPNLISY